MAFKKKLELADFLRPLHMDRELALALSRDLSTTFKHLAAESTDQFLPTPISESILRPLDRRDHGR